MADTFTVIAVEMADPSKLGRAGLRPTLRLATWLGFAGGFLLAYQSSTLRPWGWTENALEQKRDIADRFKLAAEGQPLFGETDLPE